MSQSLKTKYEKIDRSRLSESAKNLLSEIKSETKNFTNVTSELRKEFNAFYEKIVAQKPEAIFGTPEHASKTAKIKKAGKPSKSIDKAIFNKYKNSGVDIERDETRSAKPFGARVKGAGVYRKPTAKDYKNDNVYYEYRANRADVRRKFPKLEDGGHIESHHGVIMHEMHKSKK